MKDKIEINQIRIIIRQARLAQNMTQQELADKCGITRSRISKAENDIGNLPISILRTIVEKGLSGHLQIKFEF